MADSALGRNRLPVFLPENIEELESRLMLAVRISRLGKDIARKFAGRYYDALAVAMVTEAKEPSRRDALSLVADNACVTGEWAEIRPEGGDIAYGVTVTAFSSPLRDSRILETKTASITGLKEKIDTAIAEISKGVTFKTGDMLLIETGINFAPRPDINVEAKIGDRQSLKIHFK